MSYVDINVHVVWGTKNRTPFLDKQLRFNLYRHLKCYSDTKDIYLDHVNGYTDHIHCLINLKYNQNISFVVKLLKGESSSWINQQGLTNEQFRWAKGYYAASVSKNDLPKVRKYIRNQEEHHSKDRVYDDLEPPM